MSGTPCATPRAEPRAALVVLAAGEGRRVRAGTNKVLLPLAGMPVFGWSLRAAERLENIARVVVVVREQDRDAVTATVGRCFPRLDPDIVVGADTRHGSEWNALQAIADDVDAGRVDVVAIHDSARPLAEASLFRAVLDAAAQYGGALPCRDQPALVPRAAAGSVAPASPAPPRSPASPRSTGLVGVQTPQAFRAAPLLTAYRRADEDGFVGTDTASCVTRYTDLEIRCVPSPATNLKVTFPEDVALAERLLTRLGPGSTDDSHRSRRS